MNKFFNGADLYVVNVLLHDLLKLPFNLEQREAAYEPVLIQYKKNLKLFFLKVKLTLDFKL